MNDKRFVCPSCESNYWSTVLSDKQEDWVGYCKGIRCNFTWQRKDDDTVFVQVVDSLEESLIKALR